ncbi:hypothetical protein LOD99_14808 [Oopsacas minuta]|uniref:Uncharacterized protein n=1 Tax=Oopsacas minuta TaxID=111878 RepID=A0AAV7KCZ3_9METZ|nr:hypothetical protein LOD99_14808 [Oopsacas minuta]
MTSNSNALTTLPPQPDTSTEPTLNNANMFFNLTQLGLLDPIKSVIKPDSQTQPSCLAHTLSPKPLPDHNGSYRKYVDIMRKHQRNAKGPNELYSHTITSSQAYGRWILEYPKSSSPDDSWIINPRRFHHRNSEMTRYVDDMALTNKEFRLY